jgi:hypothetical protein
VFAPLVLPASRYNRRQIRSVACRSELIHDDAGKQEEFRHTSIKQVPTSILVPSSLFIHRIVDSSLKDYFMTFLAATRVVASAAATSRPVAIFLNAGRLNYDKSLNFKKLGSITTLHLNDVDIVDNIDEMVRQVKDAQAEIVITKEMEVPAAGEDLQALNSSSVANA